MEVPVGAGFQWHELGISWLLLHEPADPGVVAGRRQ